MPTESKVSTARAWVNEVKAVIKTVRKPKLDQAQRAVSILTKQPEARFALNVAGEIARLKSEKDISIRIQLSEAFLKTHKDKKTECAVVEDILAIAKKEWGVAEAKKAYEIQLKRQDDPKYNPGNKYDFKHVGSMTAKKVTKDLKDPTNSGLTEGEVAAVKLYTQSDYSYINPAVANQKDKSDKPVDWMDAKHRPDPSKATTPEEKKDLEAKLKEYEESGKKSRYEEGALHAAMIMEALKKLPKLSGRLYRGLPMTSSEFAKTYAVGKLIGDEVFEAITSFSNKELTARNFASSAKRGQFAVLLEAEVLTAQDIQKFSDYSEGESLFPPGTQMRVEAIEESQTQVFENPPYMQEWRTVKLKQVCK